METKHSKWTVIMPGIIALDGTPATVRLENYHGQLCFFPYIGERKFGPQSTLEIAKWEVKNRLQDLIDIGAA